MLGISSYDKSYLKTCRARVRRQVDAYEALAAKVGRPGGTKQALDAFEPLFFNNMVMVLDSYFVHRQRGMEGKDGNPLNEVRVLCNSMMNNNDVLMADKQIRLDPAKTVLGLAVGDRIQLTADDFARLADAFFKEVARKYP